MPFHIQHQITKQYIKKFHDCYYIVRHFDDGKVYVFGGAGDGLLYPHAKTRFRGACNPVQGDIEYWWERSTHPPDRLSKPTTLQLYLKLNANH